MADMSARLKAWGVATVARLARQHDGPSAGDSVLGKNLVPGAKAPGTSGVERILLGRCGVARRATMAQAANAVCCKGGGMRVACDGCQRRPRGPVLTVAPMWSCDPVPARNDAGRPAEISRAWVDIGLPDEALSVDDAIRALARNHPMRAEVLREEYTTNGTQKQKADRIQHKYGGRFTKDMYRHELRRGVDFVAARISK